MSTRLSTTSNTATIDTLKPLNETLDALKKIKSSLLPFLHILDGHHNKNKNDDGDDDDDDDGGINRTRRQCTENNGGNHDVHQIAQAHAAVALSVGTLRYMANRLQGRRYTKNTDDDDDSDDDTDERGNKKKDPLRMELDKMRRTLVQVQKLQRGIVSVDNGDQRCKRRKGVVKDGGETSANEKKRKLSTAGTTRG